MADRQAALCEQQALEASLLRQATAAIWSARGSGRAAAKHTSDRGGGAVGGSSGIGTQGLGTRTNPLGPRLAWLAYEELTSFFQHNSNASTSAADTRGRLRGYSSNNSDINTSPTESPLSLLQPPMPRGRRLRGAGSGGLFGGAESHASAFDVGVGVGVGGIGGAVMVARKEEEVMRKALARMDLNLVLPSGAHRGALFDPASPCGFCGLALALSPSADGLVGGDSYGCSDAVSAEGSMNLNSHRRGGDTDVGRSFSSPPGSVLRAGDVVDVDDNSEVVVKVKACGHGYHARCLASASAGGAQWRGGGGGGGSDGMELLYLPCPQCT